MSEPKKEPTAAEAMLFFSIVKNTKNKADVDWEAVATEQGFKNAEVAKVRFGQVKRKLGIYSDTSTTPRSTPKKSGGGGGAGSAATTPSKVVKTPTGRSGTKGKGRSKVKKEEEGKDEDEDEEKKKQSTSPPPQMKEEEDAANDQLYAEMDSMFPSPA